MEKLKLATANEPPSGSSNNKPEVKEIKNGKFISTPLFIQSLKSNWVLWLVLSLGTAAIFVIINLVVFSKDIFTNIDMAKVQRYVTDENLSWLQILGLLENMGFSLARIQVMSQLDLNSVMYDLVYKIAGVFLPMIYIMICANKLIASQVSDGSMAYVLSTPTNRKKVVRTQYVFLIVSLIAMYIVITCCALFSAMGANAISRANSKDPTKIATLSLVVIRTLIYCLSSFAAIFALSGVCFGASALFNKSNKSIALGGGACVLAFLCCILGLFGNKVFVSVGVGVEAMNFFNFLTIFTLIDTDSMSNFAKAATGVEGYIFDAQTFMWLWKMAILFAVGGLLAYLGGRYFIKKDLPL